MSALLTLLILAFLVWPLLQKLIQGAAQEAPGPDTARREGTPAGETLMRESQLPPVREHRPLPAAVTMPDLVPLQNAEGIVGPLTPKGVQQHPAVIEIRRPIYPRQAIVFMTVIGPCRATCPYDSLGGGRS